MESNSATNDVACAGRAVKSRSPGVWPSSSPGALSLEVLSGLARLGIPPLLQLSPAYVLALPRVDVAAAIERTLFLAAVERSTPLYVSNRTTRTRCIS